MALYEPPKQSTRGQIVDTLFILLLLFVTLFVTTYIANLGGAGEAGGNGSAEAKPVSELPISSAEKQQFQKMIDADMTNLRAVNAAVEANQPNTDEYAFSVLSLIITVVIAVAYMAFMYWVSFKEYKEVIRERFDSSEGSRT